MYQRYSFCSHFLPVIFTFSRVTTVLGTLTYCGSGSVKDTVTLYGQLHGFVHLMLQDGNQDFDNEVHLSATFTKDLLITAGKSRLQKTIAPAI